MEKEKAKWMTEEEAMRIKHRREQKAEDDKFYKMVNAYWEQEAKKKANK